MPLLVEGTSPPTRGSRRGSRILTILAVLALLGILAFWPWYLPHGDGYMLSPRTSARISNPRVEVSVWRSRGARLIVCTDGLMGPLYYRVDPQASTVQYLGGEKPWRLGPWLVPASGTQYHTSPGTEDTDKLYLRDGVATIGNPNNWVELPLSR